MKWGKGGREERRERGREGGRETGCYLARYRVDNCGARLCIDFKSTRGGREGRRAGGEQAMIVGGKQGGREGGRDENLPDVDDGNDGGGKELYWRHFAPKGVGTYLRGEGGG